MPRNTRKNFVPALAPQRPASMRPRQACLGIQEKKPETKFGTFSASMRPRQACLGILPDGVRDCACRRASMRPRQACLGIQISRRTRRSDSRHGFNEAEASLPRNTVSIVREGKESEEASMRPRQACLGIRGKKIKQIKHHPIASMRPRQACLGIQRFGIITSHKIARLQ